MDWDKLCLRLCFLYFCDKALFDPINGFENNDIVIIINTAVKKSVFLFLLEIKFVNLYSFE